MRKHEGLYDRSDEVGSRPHLREKVNGNRESAPLKQEPIHRVSRKASLE